MVTQIHPYYDLSWSLSELWDFRTNPHMEGIMQYVEPKLVRGINLPCWMWGGRIQWFNFGHHNQYGYPTANIPTDLNNPKKTRKVTYVHRYVAEQFWDFPKGYIVYRTCYKQNCVNPQHFAISYRNDPQFS